MKAVLENGVLLVLCPVDIGFFVFCDGRFVVASFLLALQPFLEMKSARPCPPQNVSSHSSLLAPPPARNTQITRRFWEVLE